MIEIDWAARIKELEAENLRLTDEVMKYRATLEKILDALTGECDSGLARIKLLQNALAEPGEGGKA